MNNNNSKIVIIPAVLAASILAAGIFALMPVERVSSTHVTISGEISQLVQTGAILAGTNLNNPAVLLLTAILDGMACVTVSVTDTAGGGDDPAVNVTIGGTLVGALNPADTATATATACAPITDGGTILVDQQGADVDTGNTVDRAIASVVSDSG